MAEPQIGERRTVNGQTGEWDGQGWTPITAPEDDTFTGPTDPLQALEAGQRANGVSLGEFRNNPRAAFSKAGGILKRDVEDPMVMLPLLAGAVLPRIRGQGPEVGWNGKGVPGRPPTPQQGPSGGRPGIASELADIAGEAVMPKHLRLLYRVGKVFQGRQPTTPTEPPVATPEPSPKTTRARAAEAQAPKAKTPPPKPERVPVKPGMKAKTATRGDVTQEEALAYEQFMQAGHSPAEAARMVVRLRALSPHTPGQMTPSVRAQRSRPGLK